MKHTSISHSLSLYLVLLIFIFNLISCHENNPTGPKSLAKDSSNFRIGLYLDNGVFDDCRTSTKLMLDEMNCSYTIINKDSILSGCLQRYSLLLMPGGDMWTYKNHLGNNGMNLIKEYVNKGGGYIGICGGAYFASYKVVWRGWAEEPRTNILMYGLNLFTGTADGPIEDFAPTYVVEQCKIKITDLNHPVCKDIQETITPYYHHGPNFLINSSQTISVLGKTVNGEKTAIIAFNYNWGKVFLISSHPEFDAAKISRGIIRNAIKWCSLRD